MINKFRLFRLFRLFSFWPPRREGARYFHSAAGQRIRLHNAARRRHNRNDRWNPVKKCLLIRKVSDIKTNL